MSLMNNRNDKSYGLGAAVILGVCVPFWTAVGCAATDTKASEIVSSIKSTALNVENSFRPKI